MHPWKLLLLSYDDYSEELGILAIVLSIYPGLEFYFPDDRNECTFADDRLHYVLPQE